MKDNLIKWIPLKDVKSVLLLEKEACFLHTFFDAANMRVVSLKDASEIAEIKDSFDLILVWKDHVFMEHIKELAGLLRKTGRFFFCGDNPLAIKYFAGALESEGADFFQTFSGAEGKRGLGDRIEAAGFRAKFFYPYPDARETEYIFTDQRGPKEDDFLKSAKRSFPGEMQLFPEGDAVLSLEKEGVFGTFSNSFLVEILPLDRQSLPVSYVKFSDHRKEEFRIFTLLSKDEKRVEKRPADPKAATHIRLLPEKEKALSKTVSGSYIVSPAEETEEGCAFPLHEGTTYDVLVDEVLLKEEKEKALAMIRSYIEDLSGFSMQEFSLTKEFEEVFLRDPKTKAEFGKHIGSFKKSFVTSDVDLVMSNIIADGQKRYIIDYEWTFFFPVPVEYIIFRILRYYLYGKVFRRSVLDESLFRMFGITGELQHLFFEMERSFQAYLSDDAEEEDPFDLLEKRDGNTVLKEHIASMEHPLPDLNMEVYYDYGGGFTEEAKASLGLQEDYKKELVIPVPEGTKSLRIDPAKAPGLLHIFYVTDENKKENRFVVPAKKVGDGTYMMSTYDPNFVVFLHPGQKKVCVSFSYDALYSYGTPEETEELLQKTFPMSVMDRGMNKTKRIFS
ncbi:MAG: hypothetical protein K5853_04980 [Lachnospiraceae bacterium]|nr:hypothetical protein [Lachnospiraceae bacterium]